MKSAIQEPLPPATRGLPFVANRGRTDAASAATGLMRWLVAGVLFMAVAVRAAEADEVRRIRAKCPLCGDKFSYLLAIQESRSGLRLDFKQFGNPHSPTELPDCPKCRFVLPDGGRDELGRRDRERLGELVASDRYKAARDETSYFRLALALETLGRPADEIGFAYLAASWQVDDEPIRCQIYLARSLSWYETYLSRPQQATPAHVRAMLLRAELLRRLGRFAEAVEYLTDLGYHPAMARQAEQNIIQQQKDLAALKDDDPHLAIADDAKVDLVMRVMTPGARALRPALAAESRLPAFPSGPYAARLGGVVTVQLSVTRSGYVVGCQVKSATADAFARSVVRTAQDWTFDPGPLDGAPSPVQLECTVYFGLEG